MNPVDSREEGVKLKALIVYLLVVNAASFLMMGYDKGQARRGERRIPEKRLFLFAAIGGGLGAWIGMRTWRHKTKHPSFQFGIPALFVLNILTIVAIIKYLS